MGIPKGGIAFFDSGIGGLTVLDACRRALPEEIFYYYGDNVHAPYGNKTPRQIERLTCAALKKIGRYRPRVVVVACNTATAVCVDKLRERFAVPIVGVEPAVFAAAKRGGECFILSTRATFESERFCALCARASKRYPKAKLTAYPCEGLAGEIERKLLIADYDFTPLLPRGEPSCVVLGCTHYGYIKEQIRRYYHCEVVDGNEGIAKRLTSILRAKNPPETHTDHSRPPSVENQVLNKRTFRKKMQKKSKNKTNKRSLFQKNKNATTRQTKGKGEIYFLGRSKKINEFTFKQMFV